MNAAGLKKEETTVIESKLNDIYAKQNIPKRKEGVESITMRDPITILSDTIPNPSNKGMYYLPLTIDLDKVTKLGYRNRTDKQDVEGEALISVFTPFGDPIPANMGKYGNMAKPTLDSHVFAINPAGEVKVGQVKDFVGSDFKVSQTWAPKEISDINIDGNNSTLGWSSPGGNEKAIKLVDNTGEEKSFPIGLGASEKGNELGGYSGGKIFIATPDNKHSTFIYGTAQQIKDEFNRFKENYGVDSVLFYDLDLKAYAQTQNSYSGELSGEYLVGRDNINSASSGAGSFIYLKK
jgi:hypothetical protein